MITRLHDGKLLRRLKSAAKARTRRSGRKSSRGRWWKAGGGGGKWLWLVWLLANVARIFAGKGGSEYWKISLLGGMSLAFAGLSLSRARKLAELLTVSSERRVLWFYPMADRDFFQWATFHFVARSTWIMVVAGIVYFVAGIGTGTNGWAVAVPGAVAEWLVVLCIAVAMARHVDKLPRWLPLGLYIAAGLMLFVPESSGKTATPLVSALPTGWLHIVMTNAAAKEWASWISACAIPPLGVLCWWLLRVLQSIYCHDELPAIEQNARPAEEPRDVIEHFAAEQVRAEEEEAGEAAMEAGGEVALPVQAAWQKQRLENWGSEIGEVIRQGHWLNRWNWSAMRPIERLVGWCLSEREKGEAQFLLGPVMPHWSNRWRTSAIAMAVGVAAIVAGTRQFNMVAVLAIAVSIGSGVPVLGGAWPATNQGRISGKLSPIFGCYPLSYWSAGLVMFKANAARTAAWLPLGLTIGVLNARTAHTTIGYSCWLAARAIILFLSLIPILVAGKFSKVTNDTTSLRLRTIPLLGLLIIVIIVVAILGAGVFMASSWWPVMFLGGTALVSWLSWAAYGWYYEHAQADLLREQT